MTEPHSEQTSLFPIILEIIAQEHSLHLRLISDREIVTQLLSHTQTRALLEASRSQHPQAALEQLAGGAVDALGRSAVTIGSEWQTRVEAKQISGQWFFKPPIVRVASGAVETRKSEF